VPLAGPHQNGEILVLSESTVVRWAFPLLWLTSTLAGSAPAADNVAENLILFNDNGTWSWYMDERVIIDPASGRLLVSSVTSSPVAYPIGRPTGAIDLVTYDLASGNRTRFQLSDIQEDDHNVAGLLILPSGKYLAMYSNHGNAQGLGDQFTRWRVSTNPHDTSAWSPEQTFDWYTTPGNAPPPSPNRVNVSYHNLFYLPSEDRVYNFSRGTYQSPNILLYDPEVDDGNPATGPAPLTWNGQLASSVVTGYSAGYYKYASNNTDRIWFVGTETHPRNYINNSVYAGYIQDGKSFDMAGNQRDANIFDNQNTGGGPAAVPDVSTFTPVQQGGVNGYTRLWTVDLALGADGLPVALYTSRFNDNADDHRLHYARFDGTAWHAYEVARMAYRLYGPEEDYTGLGAFVPGDPNTIYVSTPVDPRDPTGATATVNHEIYKGVTANGGMNWTWTAITSGSSVDNLRPIVPAWDGQRRAVLWHRGVYTTAQNTDEAIVGIIERNDERVGLVHYVDATVGSTSNTTLADGSPLTGWTLSTGAGNDGGVLAATASVPALRTSLEGLADGRYDIFAFFWANQANDWRIQAGLAAGNLQLFRDNGSQQAEDIHFDSAVVVEGGGAFLYRAYLGRADVANGSPVHVFIDDFATGANTRAWYDGVGYALVTITGDYNGDDVVDAADYVVWRSSLGMDVTAGTAADGNANGVIDQGDYQVWRSHFGDRRPGSGGGSALPVPELSAGLTISAALLATFRLRRTR
jgi:hypothetical protein